MTDLGGESLTKSLSQSLTQGDLNVFKNMQTDQAKEMKTDASLLLAEAADSAGDAKAAEEYNASVYRATFVKAETSKKTDETHMDRVKASAQAQKGKEVKRGAPSPQVEQAAQRIVERSGGQLSAATLLALREQIKDNTSPDDAIKIVEKMVPKKSLAQEALSFLAFSAEGEQKANMKQAAEQHYNKNKKEIDYEESEFTSVELSRGGFGEAKTIREEILKIMDQSAHATFSDLHNTYGSYNTVEAKVNKYLRYLADELKPARVESDMPFIIALNKSIKSVQAVFGVYGEMKVKYKQADSEAAKMG